jgi:hypothetical protein
VEIWFCFLLPNVAGAVRGRVFTASVTGPLFAVHFRSLINHSGMRPLIAAMPNNEPKSIGGISAFQPKESNTKPDAMANMTNERKDRERSPPSILNGSRIGVLYDHRETFSCFWFSSFIILPANALRRQRRSEAETVCRRWL